LTNIKLGWYKGRSCDDPYFMPLNHYNFRTA